MAREKVRCSRRLAASIRSGCGVRDVQGTICSLFDIALGFEANASGWQNIYFRSYLQGETPATIGPKVGRENRRVH